MEKEKINLSTEIKAPKEKVWRVLLEDKTYREWTSVFHPGSYVETNWKEGSKALFKTPEGDGISSIIKKHVPNDVVVIEHRAALKNGVEDPDNEESKSWAGFLEIYRVKEKDGSTLLEIEQDSDQKYVDYFKEAWEKALQKVKELSERH